MVYPVRDMGRILWGDYIRPSRVQGRSALVLNIWLTTVKVTHGSCCDYLSKGHIVGSCWSVLWEDCKTQRGPRCTIHWCCEQQSEDIWSGLAGAGSFCEWTTIPINVTLYGPWWIYTYICVCLENMCCFWRIRFWCIWSKAVVVVSCEGTRSTIPWCCDYTTLGYIWS